MQCTGLSAQWCPVHGDCSCENPEDSMSDEGCPLHSPMSDHGEDQGVETLWGSVEFEQ